MSALDFLSDNRKVLIGLLSSAVRGEVYQPGDCTGIDWQAVYDEAVRHQVMPLLYPQLAEIGGSMGIPEALLEKWRINALYEGMVQEQNYIGTGKVLEQFSNSGIPVIALKGLVLRDLYPHPCLRTMCDADLLVKPGDMDRAGRVLKEAGYALYFTNGKHTVYSHEVLPYIELHRTLVPEEEFVDMADFEAEVWSRALTVNINGAEVLSLCRQDEVLFLLLHMASHIISSGFGLRQLCDLLLVLEADKDKINLEEILDTPALLQIEKFTKVILSICHILFDIDFPGVNHILVLQDYSLVRSFTEDIFEGGVYGNSSSEYFAANRMIYYSGGEKANNPLKRFIYLFNFLFPSVEKLDIRYNYAKKHRCLLPLAWVHRLYYSMVRKDLRFVDKSAVFASMSPTEIYSKRSVLLRQLGLLD